VVKLPKRLLHVSVTLALVLLSCRKDLSSQRQAAQRALTEYCPAIWNKGKNDDSTVNALR